MMLHTNTPYPMSPPSINVLYQMVSELYPGPIFKVQRHYSKVKGQIKVTP